MTTGSTVNPSEVGWQFVPQYYTFVNKQPNRLHCFYTKASTFIHGTEGEDGKPCYGQQEIHARITSIGFQDCKVFIHSVDAQSSANGGIIIQVIGEMSNNGEPWRKFVQTFFLAEQPNGYFVLNDIFRFLKEDAVEDEPSEDELPAQDTSAAQDSSPSSAAAAPTFTVSTPASQPEPELAHTPTPVPAVAAPEPEPEATPELVAEPQVNGEHEPEPEAAPTPAEPPQSIPEPAAPSPAPSTPAPVTHEPPAPSPAPASQQPAVQAPAVSAAPAPAAPPVRKTWANLAATGSQKWGSNVAEAKGVSEVPVSTISPAPAGTSQPPSARQPQNQQHPAYTNAMSVTTAQCFVKGVIETVSDNALKSTLTQRFGPIKEIEIVRAKACAFIEFSQLESAKRAIVASLPVIAGGEGGVRIGEGSTDGPSPRISIETRKERGERPPPRNPPLNGDRGRGSFRGRGAPRGRGVPPQK
ncbi:hypothetical protein BC835DRAFT_1403998 [Cytidiella melzeri]|nr:hypothetical protein BC835DRAFT_1403998 [Cytidiella melzeri]